MDDLPPLILVVDDEENFREIFRTKLTAAGFRVETAVNGAEGVQKAKQLKPKLVLMDVKMPVMDGAAAALALREDPETRNVKVAFLTSLGDPRADMRPVDDAFSKDFGADQYLKKTDDLDMLAGKVKALLG
ncbi:MAG: response regulator [Patescibacteria group bacterium]|nr:response regulator [Patescibacteria group bacterium]